MLEKEIQNNNRKLKQMNLQNEELEV